MHKEQDGVAMMVAEPSWQSHIFWTNDKILESFKI